MAQPPDRGLVTLAGRLAILLGAGGIAGYLAGWLFAGEVPLVLGYGHVAASVLELALAYGILKRRRAAWAFAIALEATMVLVGLLGLSYTLRAGVIGTASAVATLGRLVLMTMLIAENKEFK